MQVVKVGFEIRVLSVPRKTVGYDPRKITHLAGAIGVLRIRMGFGVYYTITLIRNPQHSTGNY